MDEMKKKLSTCFDRLQDLQIKPTKANMETLLQTLYDLQDVYNKLSEMEGNNNAKPEREGRSAADPE